LNGVQAVTIGLVGIQIIHLTEYGHMFGLHIIQNVIHGEHADEPVFVIGDHHAEDFLAFDFRSLLKSGKRLRDVLPGVKGMEPGVHEIAG